MLNLHCTVIYIDYANEFIRHHKEMHCRFAMAMDAENEKGMYKHCGFFSTILTCIRCALRVCVVVVVAGGGLCGIR